MANPKSCFISYSHKNKAFVDKLYADLVAAGIPCWRDEIDLIIGKRIIDALSEAIRDHDHVLLCCSKHSLSSTWVEDEISMTIEKERRDPGGDLTLIPLNLDDYLFDSWSSGHAARIRERLAADFRNWRKNHVKYQEQLTRLLRALS